MGNRPKCPESEGNPKSDLNIRKLGLNNSLVKSVLRWHQTSQHEHYDLAHSYRCTITVKVGVDVKAVSIAGIG